MAIVAPRGMAADGERLCVREPYEPLHLSTLFQLHLPVWPQGALPVEVRDGPQRLPQRRAPKPEETHLAEGGSWTMEKRTLKAFQRDHLHIQLWSVSRPQRRRCEERSGFSL